MRATPFSIQVIQPENPAFFPAPGSGEVVPPEVDALIEEMAAKLALERHLKNEWAASFLETETATALDNAAESIRRSLAKASPAREFFLQWARILKEKTVKEICVLLRSQDSEHEQLRLCRPFFGMMPEEVHNNINHIVYSNDL